MPFVAESTAHSASELSSQPAVFAPAQKTEPLDKRGNSETLAPESFRRGRTCNRRKAMPSAAADMSRAKVAMAATTESLLSQHLLSGEGVTCKLSAWPLREVSLADA